MILRSEQYIEKYPNGNVMYEETRGIINPLYIPFFENTRVNTKGETWVRQGVAKRFWPNGQLNWQICYKEDGSIKNEGFKCFSQDGKSIICHG